MMNSWTNEDIEAILVQLNNQNLPFKKYEFSALGEGLSLLGSGASANVYEAIAKGKKKKEYAIKVIGFGSKHVDSESFRNSVEAQTNLGLFENNIVKIHDSIEIRVWIEGEHTVSKTEKIDSNEETKPEGCFLHLQFILMEKISPIFVTNRFKHKLIPHKLEIYDEKEILKLSYDIGTALERAHKMKLIHRDIKLENIFYDLKGEHYKLGDFGIARTTDDGLASTVAFTKGYGAPEVVGTLEDKYDYTADIYSFGMILYVLLNEIRFPESENYHPNVYQYVQGYIPPEPVNGSDEFVRIILKMISFDPDDRYQSMEEVLNEFEKLKYGHRVKYQREHKSTALVLGTTFVLIGFAIWKLSFAADMELDFSVWTYIFCALCVGKSVLKIMKKKTGLVSTGIFGIGMYILISAGFSWWKLLLLIIIAAFSDVITGVLGGGAIVANITYLIMNAKSFMVGDFYEYRWMAVLLLSLGVILLFLHYLLGDRSEQIAKVYFEKNSFWITATLFYAVLFLAERSLAITNGFFLNLYEWMFGQKNIDWIMSWNPRLVGICGTFFCIIWMVRECFLVFIEKKRVLRELEERYY